MISEFGNGAYFAILPAHVRYDENLKPIEILMFAEITSLLNSCGFCETNKIYFANLFRCSTQTVTKYLDTLKVAGYINIFPAGNGNLIIVPYLSQNEFQESINRGDD